MLSLKEREGNLSNELLFTCYIFGMSFLYVCCLIKIGEGEGEKLITDNEYVPISFSSSSSSLIKSCLKLVEKRFYSNRHFMTIACMNETRGEISLWKMCLWEIDKKEAKVEYSQYVEEKYL